MNEKHSDDKIIADKLNVFFIESIYELKQRIPFQPYSRDITEHEKEPWLEFSPVNEAEVNRVLSNFKSMSGIRNVNKDVMRMSMNVCGELIVSLVNDSFRSGCFPEAWKYTIVTPIPKKKGSNKAEDQRAILKNIYLRSISDVLILITLFQYHYNLLYSSYYLDLH